MPWGQNPVCGACSQAVYFSEQKFAIGKVFHANCLRCCKCSKSTDSTTTTQHDGDVYCKNCSRSYFSQTQHVPQRKSSITMASTVAVSDKCPKCQKTVYFAEKVMALNQAWHKLCLSCSECSKRLDPGSVNDHAGQIYCKGCHSRKNGARGYGYGVGSGILQSY